MSRVRKIKLSWSRLGLKRIRKLSKKITAWWQRYVLQRVPFIESCGFVFIVLSDQYQYLGNCPPTPPPTQHPTLTLTCCQLTVVELGEGWVGGSPDTDIDPSCLPLSYIFDTLERLWCLNDTLKTDKLNNMTKQRSFSCRKRKSLWVKSRRKHSS